ncbi:succinyldiaminopimelate transaminase, partial [Catenulispora pinisilvae]|uniref:succinyldiaminopimelate transaminase n=1 Tax=Catenulispora pinisilvae TaxID=2705253 RepID=UPI0018926418
GTPALREAAVGWMTRRLGVTGVTPTAVLPVIGTKELVAWLPTLLGLGPGDHVAIPSVAYPTYDVGARIAGADTLVAAPEAGADLVRAHRPKLIWLNSPANPNGRVASAAELRAVVTAARDAGTIVVSDECYIELAWDAEPVSLLHPDVSGASHEGLLAVHSLSKRSNLAGYRAGFVTGDPAIVADLLEVRKHAGLIMPRPVQDAMTVALNDDVHAAEQKERYRRRREVLRDALGSAGFRIDHSEAGLYLWSSRDEDCWTTVEWLSERGILVAPGDFYGEAGARHVRVALTASDERVAAAAARLTAS